jgi:hypothetical protein
MNRLPQGWGVVAVPMAVAAAVRAWLLFAWSGSAFRWYHTVSGLDMMTHVRETADFSRGARGFSFYSLLAAPGYLLGGPDGMVAVQAMLGIATAGLVALAAWRLYGHRAAAILAGLIAALYAPAAMYELFHLKESTYLFSAALSLAMLLEARHRHFARPWALAAGAAAMLPATIRFPGLLWGGVALAWLVLAIRQHDLCHLHREDGPRGFGARLLRHCAWPILGAALVLAAAAGFNAALGHRQLPFGSGANLAFYLGGVVNPKTPAAPPAPSMAAPATEPEAAPAPDPTLRKVADLFRAVELSNNLNYYFVRANLPGLAGLLGPLLLLPLAFTGLLLLVGERRMGAGTVLVILFFLSVALPMVMFVPLARYRLTLLPALALWSAFTWVRLVPAAGQPWPRQALPVALGLFAVLMLLLGPRGNLPLRADDFLAYARALRQVPARADETLPALLMAHQLAPRRPATVLALAHGQMARGDFPAARQVLHPLATAPAPDLDIRLAYAATAMGCGDPAAAAAVLEAVPPGQRNLDYHYQLGECRRLQGRFAEAAEAYRAGLADAQDDTRRAIFRQALARLPAPLSP